MRPLTHGSLFSGIGGFDAAADSCGYDTRWQVEIDPFCCRVLAKHWPQMRRYGDIRTVSGADLEPVGRPLFLTPVTYAQVLRHWTARYVRSHPLLPGQQCLHCAGVPVVRAAHELAPDWERRRRTRLCWGCWTRFAAARWRP